MKAYTMRVIALLSVAQFGVAVLMFSGSASSSGNSPTLSPLSAAVLSGGTIQFTARVERKRAEDLTWYVDDVAWGSPSLGTISSTGLYMAPEVTAPKTFNICVGERPKERFIFRCSIVRVFVNGTVTSTAHPLVAKYTFLAPPDASVQIEFGPDTNYGRETWVQRAPRAGGEVNILVAGMRANTIYHMRAQVTVGDGLNFVDDDHTFTTGDLPAGRLPNLVAQTTPGQNPQSGVELVDLVTNTLPNGMNKGIEAIVTDLDGNVIWFYDPTLPIAKPTLTPIKLLPNGHFLLAFNDISPGSADGQNSVMQEVDLTGRVVWQMSYTDLNHALAESTCAGCNITVIGTHHDFALLPNGHLIILATEKRFFPSLDGYPNGTNVIGDVIIDLDHNRKPAWIWSTFDHLDPNRHLMGLPDWTHSNAIVYSPHDHNLILSIRHQSWVIKIDYRNGKGTGDILWKLGYQGDFTLLDGTAPIDWQYAQHDFNLIGPTSEDTFEAEAFDNGNLRVVDANGTICGGSIPCYSRAINFRIDESARTAALTWVDKLSDFSFFGGSTRLLPNGDIEYDECVGPAPGLNAAVFEVTRTLPPQTVWQLQVKDQYAYRVFRIPSLYPGVQW